MFPSPPYDAHATRVTVPGWVPGPPPAHCTRITVFLSPYDPQALTLYLTGVRTPALYLRSLLGPFMPFL